MKKSKTENNYNTKILVTGGKVSNLINLCTDCGLTLKSVVRVDKSSVQIELDDKDYRTLKKLNLSDFEVKTLHTGGLPRLLHACLYRIGLIIGIVLSIITMALLNNRLFTIHVYGLSRLSESEIVSSINEFGINRFSSLNFDKSALENFLMQKHNLSLVSVISKGNSLIVSVKEELPDISDSYIAITSDYNMVITAITVYSGTGKVNVGDIVYAGDTLVEPFIKKGDDIVYVEPRAEIDAVVFFSASQVFKYSEEKSVRTGNKKIVNYSTNLGKYKLWEKSFDVGFESYELETNESLVSSYFLPIMLKKTYAYELTTVTVQNDYDNMRESVVDSVKTSALSAVPESLTVDSVDVIEKDIDGGKLINVSVSCKAYFSYKNHIAN